MNSQEFQQLIENTPFSQLSDTQFNQPEFDFGLESAINMNDINYQATPPPHVGRHPDLEPIKSNFKFAADVLNDNPNIVFVEQKLFIKMNSTLTINVSYTPLTSNAQMILRAMVVFTSSADMHLPVKRCANHRMATPAMDSPMYAQVSNIMKVTHPKVVYHGMDEGTTYGERLSIAVPLDQSLFDADTMRVTESIRLEFGCQNSCSSGINRRQTSMVFTLEDEFGNLYGKAAIQFKVCSCPKRDAERENPTKRKHANNEPFPKGKRPMYSVPSELHIKAEPTSEEEQPAESLAGGSMVTEVKIKFPNHLVPQLLQQAQQILAGEIVASKNKNASKEQYITPLRELEKMEASLKRTGNWRPRG